MRLRIRPSCLCCGDSPIAMIHRRRFLAGVGAAIAGVAIAPRRAFSDTAPEIAYDSIANLFDMPPDLYFGEVSGIALNSKGHAFVLSRGNTTGPAYGAAAAQLLEFGPDGKFIREIGHNLYAWSFAHTVKVDAEDNVWVTDKGSDMVIKFTPNGRVDMVFGRKQEASDEGTAPLKHPNPPLAAEDAQQLALQRQLVDAAGEGVGAVQCRLRARRDADRPRRAGRERAGGDLRLAGPGADRRLRVGGHGNVDGELAQVFTVAVEHLNAPVAAVGDINPA